MKRFALFFSLFMLCLVVKANPVSRSQALKEAKSFLATKGVEMNTSEAAYRAPRKANAQESESSYYYIFNVGNDEGFVIVSGDDRTEQILGYSDTGSFDEENMPEPLKEWLDGYAKEMESIIEVDATEYESLSPRRAQENTKKSIAPLTTSKWAAGTPYNEKIPIVWNDAKTKSKHAPVGCTSVALAQLLYYYKTINKTKTAISSIPAGTLLDWDNMLDEYVYKGYTTTQKNAISNLMYYCATALKAKFTYSATSASEQLIPSVLINNFGYKSSIAYVTRTYYSVSEWDSLIYNELLNRRPVAYTVWNGEGGGHVLVVDGFDGAGLFHINWGWRGKYNGFFRLSVLNKTKSGYLGTLDNASYSRYQSAILYVSPTAEVNTSKGKLSAVFTQINNQSITCKYENQSGIYGSYYYGVGIIDNKGNIVLLKQSSSDVRSMSTGSAYTPLSYNLSPSDFSNKDISIGKYEIVPIYKLATDSDWKLCQYPKNSPLIANYYSTTNLSISSLSAKSKITASIDFSGNRICNSKQYIKATIFNNSTEVDYVGNIYLFASTNSTKGKYISTLPVNLGKKDNLSLDLPFTPTAAGKYNIWLSTDSEGSNVIGTSVYSIVSGSEGTLTFNIGYTISNLGTSRRVWGNTLSMKFTGINNNTKNPILASFTVWIREFDKVSDTSYNLDRYNTYADNAEYYNIDVNVPAYSSIELPLIFDNLKLNTKYDVMLVYNGKAVKTISPITMIPGVTTWKTDGTFTASEPTSSITIASNVVAVDITGATIVSSIKPNSNPNVLYYLGDSQTVPSGITNCNVVKGDVAENITLRDSCDFFVPKTFTAKNINFTIKLKEGYNGSNNINWNTIALPFDVKSVKNTTDNKEIDWFHSDSDTGKHFWVKRFDKLDTNDNSVIFKSVEKMQAYEPYIINVPDNKWGPDWDLRNKNITFYGEKAVLHNEANIGTNSSYFNFVGTTMTKIVDNSWVLNKTGNAFKYYIYGAKDLSNTILPFHAYLTLTMDNDGSANSAKASLRIKFDGDEDSTTGIMAPFAADEKVVDVYNINGVKVASKNLKNGSVDMSDLPKGIYVVNGKKFIQY